MSRRRLAPLPDPDPRWRALIAAVEPAPPLDYQPPTSPWLAVCHQDDSLVAFDKPAGLLSVPGKPDDHQDSLEWRAKRADPSARLVHRLDRGTSGLMVMARTLAAQRDLGRQFEARAVSKTYLARVAGRPPVDAGTVDAPICADWPNRPRQMVPVSEGREAVTRWRIRQSGPWPGLPEGASLIELTPATGRTHQLRVHMAWLGCPILGDEFYAPPSVRAAANRLLLHAERLELTHPATAAPLRLTAPAPF